MPRHMNGLQGRATSALGLLAIILAIGAPATGVAGEPDSTDINRFPRCKLDAVQRDQFHKRYGAGHLAMAQGNLEQAQRSLEDALRICVDDEVLWFLAIVHEDMGEPKIAARYRASWQMQRRLHDLNETPPTAPSTAVADADLGPKVTSSTSGKDERFGRRPPSELFPMTGNEVPSLNLDPAPGGLDADRYITSIPLGERHRGAAGVPGSKRIESLPLKDRPDQSRRPAREVLEETFGQPPTLSPLPATKSEKSGARSEERLERTELVKVELNLSTTPDGADVLLDGVLIGQTPLRSIPIVADRQHTIVIEKDGYHRLERELYVSPGANQHLFLTLRRK